MSNAATLRQIVAADPNRSTWLSANAGSGKTTVLTNRVARLLLNGVPPQNILCLTYTKAAASEMQNRLFETLGRWAMLHDEALFEALGALGETGKDDLSTARTLFARAIDTPGGLKIQTIHALCGSILRQFPLEAGVTPNFKEMDTPQQKELIADVLESIADGDGLAAVAKFHSGDLVELASAVVSKADDFRVPLSREQIFPKFGLPLYMNVEVAAREAVSVEDISFLKQMLPSLYMGSKATDVRLADAIQRLPNAPSQEIYEILKARLLTQKGEVQSRLITKAVPNSQSFLPRLETIALQVRRASETIINIEAAEQAIALQTFAQEFLPAYRHAKSAAGLLDFDDLIRYTRDLLSKQSLQWVMYRLDGKIDHILVDEAQDTSPAQWDVIEALAEEMASGESNRPRTLFVVGDKKQSIYSFQGADAAGFDKRAERFRDRLAEGQGLRPELLEFSFRSSPAVLDVVDQVFNAEQISGLGAHHQAFQTTLPGRVDLWPLVPQPDKVDERKWSETGDRLVENDAVEILATKIAKHIKHLLGNETIPAKDGPKRIEAGDIMVLVQRRSKLFDHIIQACKGQELEIAGADRLKIGSELAVRDLLALCSFLAMPDDNLSLAAALRSPLFGWTERDLYQLAAARGKKRLWEALRNKDNEHPETLTTLRALRKDVDYARPFELLETILTQFHGRERLLARLGNEAEDGINELLNQALAYERDNVPSLTGFLVKAQASDVEVKRQSDTTGNQIRVMTVHGAKGLESPVVILPDTTYVARDQTSGLVIANGLPVTPGKKDRNPPFVADARSALHEADRQERNRLLYVAMTRAEKWLIVCGTEPHQNQQRINWHKTVQTGLEQLGAAPLDAPLPGGLRYEVGKWPDAPENHEIETKNVPVQRILEYGRAKVETKPDKVVAPSDLPGLKALGGEGRGEEEAKRRGRQIHLLLEHLPGTDTPRDVARSLLSVGPDAADDTELPSLISEAQNTLKAHPKLFSPEVLAEVGVAGPVPSLGLKISGVIDRMIVGPTSVMAIDFKTNVVVPETAQQVPDGILRQMGAYLEALEHIYPDKRIDLAILWTANATLMPLEHAIVRSVLQDTPTS